jgi:hypothetical protein
MATKKRGRKKAATKRNVIVIGKRKATRRRSHSVGATHHAKRKRVRGRVGATGGSSLKQIVMLAVGVGVGAGITHMLLRPVEKRLVDKFPMAEKFLGAGEVLLGGYIALKGKRPFVKSLGVGILAGGVHALMKQANLYKNVPKVGDIDETELRIPLNESFRDQVAGILRDSRREVFTKTVAGSINGTDRTEIVASTVNGEYEDVLDTAYFVKG